MKLLILSIALANIISLTPNYYQECSDELILVDSEKGILSTEECRKHDSEGGYCCYLHYIIEDGNYYSDGYNTYYYYYYYKKKENETKSNLRLLQEPQRYCYGLTKEGFDNIEDVIDELQDESGIDKLEIDCGNKQFKYNLMILIILLMFFFIS